MIADIVVDLQYGDCGKGKVTHHLCKNGDYTHVVRYNGGCNAGHTIFHKGKQFITHHIPAGVFFGIKSIIGPGCVVNPDQFFKEIDELEKEGIKTEGLVFIAKNAHVITNNHIEEDGKDTKIGTTKRGNGPAYRDKYARKGLRAGVLPSLSDYIIDLYDELHSTNDVKVLFEGAQGFGLDIDWGDYPYVTSSHCTSAAALLNGVPPQAIRKIWGVAKMYETYVGAKKFQPDDDVFNMLRKIGKEYGATTGRPRQCNWMNWDLLERASNINGVTDLVFNKVDVLEQMRRWRLYEDGNEVYFDSGEKMKKWIENKISHKNINVYFSGDKEKI
jgi:adenylosuccinate synthase